MKLSLDGRSEGPDGCADWVEAWYSGDGLMDRTEDGLLGGRMYPGHEQCWTAIQRAPEQYLPRPIGSDWPGVTPMADQPNARAVSG
jgi:hypothetical protein